MRRRGVALTEEEVARGGDCEHTVTGARRTDDGHRRVGVRATRERRVWTTATATATTTTTAETTTSASSCSACGGAAAAEQPSWRELRSGQQHERAPCEEAAVGGDARGEVLACGSDRRSHNDGDNGAGR